MITVDEIVILIPTRGRPTMLETMLEALADTPAVRCVVIHDERMPRWYMNVQGRQIVHVKTPRRLGYWQAMNWWLRTHPGGREVIGFFANDCLFHEGWLDEAVAGFNEHFPDGLGLLQIRDDVHGGGFHSTHGFIARGFLNVLYGKERFPPYAHHYADNELAQFSKELQRFAYWERCHVEHLHPDVGKRDRDGTDRDIATVSTPCDRSAVKGETPHERYDRRYLWWKKSGKAAAEERLQKESEKCRGRSS